MKRVHFATIDSTQRWVREHAQELPIDELVLITADEQTAGEGQFHRKWLSPPHVNIYATFHFTLPAGQRDLETTAQLLALSGAALLLEMGYPIQVKWPNDLLLGGRKLAGTRVETVMEGDLIRLIAGIGINVNMSVEQLARVDQPATSLLTYSGTEQEIGPIIDKLALEFEQDLLLFKKEGFAPFRPLLEQLLYVLPRPC